MAKINFNVDDSGFQALLDKIPQVPVLAIKYIANDVWGNIKRESPTDQGRLAGSFRLAQRDDLAYHIQSGVQYALTVYSGSGARGNSSLGASGRPYDIFPVARRAIYWPAAAHPVKAVYGHLGIPSNPYIDRAFDSTTKRTGEFVKKALREAGVS